MIISNFKKLIAQLQDKQRSGQAKNSDKIKSAI